MSRVAALRHLLAFTGEVRSLMVVPTSQRLCTSCPAGPAHPARALLSCWSTLSGGAHGGRRGFPAGGGPHHRPIRGRGSVSRASFPPSSRVD